MQHIKTDYCHNLIIHILDYCDHVNGLIVMQTAVFEKEME